MNKLGKKIIQPNNKDLTFGRSEQKKYLLTKSQEQIQGKKRISSKHVFVAQKSQKLNDLHRS